MRPSALAVPTEPKKIRIARTWRLLREIASRFVGSSMEFLPFPTFRREIGGYVYCPRMAPPRIRGLRILSPNSSYHARRRRSTCGGERERPVEVHRPALTARPGRPCAEPGAC